MTDEAKALVERLLLSPGLMTRDTVARVIDVEVCEASADLIETQAREIARLREALEEGRRAIGDHSAPDDCYATGPLTGDDYRDLVECPACSFIAVYEALKGPDHD